MNQIQSTQMINFYKKLCVCSSYIIIFYNICIGTVAKLPASNLIKAVNQDDLCRTLTNRVHTAIVAIASAVVLLPLRLRQHSDACTKRANFKHQHFTQYWPGTVAYPAGRIPYCTAIRDNPRMSLYPVYACTEGKVSLALLPLCLPE